MPQPCGSPPSHVCAEPEVPRWFESAKYCAVGAAAGVEVKVAQSIALGVAALA